MWLVFGFELLLHVCDLQESVKKNPVMEFICAMEPVSPLNAALSTRPEVRHAITRVVRQKMAGLGFPEPEVDQFWGMYKEQRVDISQESFLDTLELCMMIGYHIHSEEDR